MPNTPSRDYRKQLRWDRLHTYEVLLATTNVAGHMNIHLTAPGFSNATCILSAEMTPEIARELRDALIEAYPLVVAKPAHYAAYAYGMEGREKYAVKKTFLAMRSENVADGLTEEHADIIADALNAKEQDA